LRFRILENDKNVDEALTYLGAGSVVELEPVLERLESYRTVLPEAAVEIILSKAGLPPTDPQARSPLILCQILNKSLKGRNFSHQLFLNGHT